LRAQQPSEHWARYTDLKKPEHTPSRAAIDPPNPALRAEVVAKCLVAVVRQTVFFGPCSLDAVLVKKILISNKYLKQISIYKCLPILIKYQPKCFT
jgi:hypothetical protein